MWKCRDEQWRHASQVNLKLYESDPGADQAKGTAFDAWKGSSEEPCLTLGMTAYGRADEARLNQAHVL